MIIKLEDEEIKEAISDYILKRTGCTTDYFTSWKPTRTTGNTIECISIEVGVAEEEDDNEM